MTRRPTKHRRMAVTIQTSQGPMAGTITGDPKMPPETMAALRKMTRRHIFQLAVAGPIAALVSGEAFPCVRPRQFKPNPAYEAAELEIEFPSLVWYVKPDIIPPSLRFGKDQA